jgi:hypothetical protein
MNKEKKYNIQNFIGVYENYVLPEQCDEAIKLYEGQDKFNRTINRLNSEMAPVTLKQDKQFFANAGNMETWWSELKPLMLNVDMAFKHYVQTVGADGQELFGSDYHYATIKIQKTVPTEGYHAWHIEKSKSYEDRSRVFVYAVYLNDVEEGGETEFLHFSKREKPTKGKIVIWPASFPYLHRGNPPLSGEKYLLTSWILIKN